MTSHAFFDSHSRGENWLNQPESFQNTTGIEILNGIFPEQTSENTVDLAGSDSLSLFQKSLSSMNELTSTSSLFNPNENVVNMSESFVFLLQLQQEEQQRQQQQNVHYLSQEQTPSLLFSVSNFELASSGATSPSDDLSSLLCGVANPPTQSLFNSPMSLAMNVDNQPTPDVSGLQRYEEILSQRQDTDPFNSPNRAPAFLEELNTKTANLNNFSFQEFLFPLRTPSTFRTSSPASFQSPIPTRIIGDSHMFKSDLQSTTPSRVITKYDDAMTLTDGLSPQIDAIQSSGSLDFSYFTQKSDLTTETLKKPSAPAQTSPSHTETQTETWVQRTGIKFETPSDGSQMPIKPENFSSPTSSSTRLVSLHCDDTQRLISNRLPKTTSMGFENGQLTPVSVTSNKSSKSFMERLAAVSDSPGFQTPIKKKRVKKPVVITQTRRVGVKRLSERLAKGLESLTPSPSSGSTISSLSTLLSPASSILSPTPSEGVEELTLGGRKTHGRKPTKIEPLKMQIDEVLEDSAFDEHFSVENDASEGKTYAVRDFNNWQCAWCWCQKVDTPAIRKGPFGQKSLCNACGMFFVRNKCLPRDRRDRRHTISVPSKSPSDLPKE